MIRAILFDLDNTLIDRQSAFAVYASDLLTRLMPRMEGIARQKMLEAIVKKDMFGYFPRWRFYRWLARQADSDYIRNTRTFYEQQSLEIARHVKPRAEVCQFVKSLQLKYLLAVVTNGTIEAQQEKLKNAGLKHVFEHVFISQQAGCAKPGFAIFRKALRRIQVPADETLFVGDDLEKDIIPSQQIGMKTCWIDLAGKSVQHPVNANLAINDVCELAIDELNLCLGSGLHQDRF